MNTTRMIGLLPLGLALVSPLACANPDEESVGQDYELVASAGEDARCVERPLLTDANDRATCRIVEARPRDADGACRCDDAARRPLDDQERSRVRDAAERDARTRGRDLDCACEVRQLDGARLRACLDQLESPVIDDARPVDGWCYHDAERDPALGRREVAARCGEDAHRLIRFEGAARLRADAAVFVRCD